MPRETTYFKNLSRDDTLTLTKSTDKQVGGSHYKDCSVQPVQYIMANKLNFCEGNVVKYVTRHRLKGAKNDLLKARHYIDLLLEIEYGEGE